MPLVIDTLDALPDVPRLVEDLAATIPLYRDAAAQRRPLHPSTAILQLLGEAYLATAPPGLSESVRRHPGLAAVIDSFHWPALNGSTRLSYFLMALILGRPGLRAHFRAGGQYDWDGCLRWLVLHGVHEMRLWPFLSEGFVRELRAPSLLIDGKRLSPLQALVISERPDVLEAFRAEPQDRFAAHFEDWLLHRGVPDYQQTWLLTSAEVARKIREDPSGAWAGGALLAAASEAEDGFPDGPAEPMPLAPALPPARTAYRRHGQTYPCAMLDAHVPAAGAAAFAAGIVRPGLRGGFELLSPFTEIRLPDQREPTAFLQLDLAVPEPLRAALRIRLRVRDALGPVRFEHAFPATALTDAPLVIPVTLPDLAPRLEIAFVLPGHPTEPDGLGFTYAVLRALLVWQVMAA